MDDPRRDPSLDTLLDLHGQVLVVDPAGRYWVKFIVRRVPVSKERPHGLDYSFTLHDAEGARLVDFDNAHPVRRSKKPGGKKSGPYDHAHRFEAARPYAYRDAAALLADFWAEVDTVLKEKGVF